MLYVQSDVQYIHMNQTHDTLKQGDTGGKFLINYYDKITMINDNDRWAPA